MSDTVSKSLHSVVTVTLNTAIDRVLEVEHFTVGAHAHATELVRYPAGKGINVSRTLARLGRDNVATGFVGQEEAAQFERVLGKSGPGHALCQLLAARGPTRENITILDRSENTDTHLRTTGYELADRDVDRILSKLGLLARPGVALVYCGSLPGGADEMDFNAMVHLGISAGAEVVLDLQGTLLRHILGLNETTLNLDHLPPAPAHKPFSVIAINRAQIAQTFHLQSEIDDETLLVTAAWMSQLSRYVLIRLGSHAAMLVDKTGRRWVGRVTTESGEIKSTVGSGDCLLAGLLDAQLRQMAPNEALRFALATATASAQAAALAAFDREQVTQWLGRVHVKAMAAESTAVA